MMERRRFKLYVLRYVDNVVRQEFVNIGVCLVEDGVDRGRFVGFDFLGEWSRLQQFFPGADVAFLREWCAAFADQIRSEEGREAALETLETMDSTISVFIETKAIETTSEPIDELRTVSKMYIGERSLASTSAQPQIS